MLCYDLTRRGGGDPMDVCLSSPLQYYLPSATQYLTHIKDRERDSIDPPPRNVLAPRREKKERKNE